jgi:tetratricopeptide (TPR) repeat protein
MVRRLGPLVLWACLPLVASGCARRLVRLSSPDPEFTAISNLGSLPQGDERYDCGPEAISAVTEFYGKAIPVKQTSLHLFNRALKGTIVAKIPEFVRDLGFRPVIRNGTLAELRGAVDENRPVIVMIRLRPDALHFFVVVGYSDRKRSLAFLSYPGKGGPVWAYCDYGRFQRYWEGAANFMLEIRPADPTLDRAIALERQRRWPEAKQVYLELLTHDPRLHVAWIGVGNCYYGLKELDQAADAYRKALQLAPGDAQAKNNLAHVLWESGTELSQALELATEAVSEARSRIERLEESLRSDGEGSARENLAGLVEQSRRHLASFLGTYGDILSALERHREAADAFLASHDLLKEDAARRRRLRQAADALRKGGLEEGARQIESRIPAPPR